jgi:DNA repair ATPase RecN
MQQVDFMAVLLHLITLSIVVLAARIVISGTRGEMQPFKDRVEKLEKNVDDIYNHLGYSTSSGTFNKISFIKNKLDSTCLKTEKTEEDIVEQKKHIKELLNYMWNSKEHKEKNARDREEEAKELKERANRLMAEAKHIRGRK